MAAKLAALVLLGLCAGGASAKRSGICETYVVAPGDSVVSIAQKFSVSQSDLEKAIAQCDSNYKTGDFLQANQRICLPPTFSACQYVRTAGTSDNCKYYIIQSGDTLESIALSLDLLRLDLEDLNPQASTLQVNQFVKLTGWTNSCPEPGNQEACRVYIAAGGDSLSTIAMAFSVDLSDVS
jgi:LysM repeat protein